MQADMEQQLKKLHLFIFGPNVEVPVTDLVLDALIVTVE